MTKALRLGRWECNCQTAPLQMEYSNYCHHCGASRPDPLPPMTELQRQEVLKKLTDEQLEAISVELTGDQHRILVRNGARMANLIGDFVNSMDDEPSQECAEILSRMHRTLQQNAMRFFMWFVEKMAKNQDDMRNEASVRLAKRILSEIPDHERHLPNV